MNSNWVGSGMARARSVTNMHRALEHRDQQQVLAAGGGQLAVVVADPRAQLGDARLDLVLGEQHRLDVAGVQPRPIPRARPQRATSRPSDQDEAPLPVRSVSTPIARRPATQPLAAQRRADRHPALAPPAGDQCVHRPGSACRSAPWRRRPAASSGSPAAEPGPAAPPRPRVSSRTRAGVRQRGRAASVVEQLGVLAQRSRRAGQRLGDPAAEHVLQQRQHLAAQPDPGEPGSVLCGSCQAVRPSSAHAAWVTARRTPSSGRHHGGSYGRIPAIDRAPEPRPSPSSTVSAWSSRVCANSTGPSGAGRFQRRVAGGARGRLRAAVATHLHAEHLRVDTSQLHGLPAGAVRRTAAEPACSPWSTISAVVGRSCAAATAVSARESGPPDSATHHRRRRAGGRVGECRRPAARSVLQHPVDPSLGSSTRLAAAGFRGPSRSC